MASSASDHLASKSSKWFANKSLKLSFNRRKFKSSSSISSPGSPMSPRYNPRNSSREDELRQVFRYFDENGDGKISALELRSYFGSVGEYMSHEEAEEVIKEADKETEKEPKTKQFVLRRKAKSTGEAKVVEYPPIIILTKKTAQEEGQAQDKPIEIEEDEEDAEKEERNTSDIYVYSFG